jgi:aminoglycoside phosphotransferase (APT) family kinase protein
LRQHLGIEVEPDTIKLEYRGWRWMATMPGFLAFIADNPEHVARLSREGRLLRTLAARMHCHVPRIHLVHPDLALQVRAMIPGTQLGGDGRERAFAELPQGIRLADELGRTLAELHGAITLAEAAAIGFDAGECAGAGADDLEARLKPRLSDPEIAATFARVLERYREIIVDPADVVLIHGDVWGGNLAVDCETGALNGIFDFDDARIGDRHIDLMYIHSFGELFTERLFAIYAERSNRPISRQRTALYHAMAAFAALADMESEGDEGLMEQRRRWVAAVCHGPIARAALE